jgi:hypothetical protein
MNKNNVLISHTKEYHAPTEMIVSCQYTKHYRSSHLKHYNGMAIA